METSPLAELHSIFAEWLARYRLARAFRASGLGLALGAGLGLLLGVALIAGRLVLPAELAWLVGGLLLVGLTGGGMLGLVWPVPSLPTARRFDRQFGLRERLSTALELAERPEASTLTPLQLADALETARRVDLPRALPLRLPWRSLAAALLLCALTAGLAWGLRGQFELVQQQRELEQAIAAEVVKVEEIAAGIEQLETLDPQVEAAILQSLQATLQELQAAETKEEALAVLAEGQAELQSFISPDSQAALEALAQAGQTLAASQNPELQSAGEALQEGDLASASQALEGLDASQLSAEELAQLAQDLSAAAQALQSSQPAAAAIQNAASAAAAAASTDPAQSAQAAQAAEEAQAALQQAAADLQALQGALQAGQAAMQAASSLAQAQAVLGAAGAGAGTGVLSSGQPGSGVSTDPGSQNPGSGGGAGRGEGRGSEAGSGQAAGTTPIQTSNSPGDGGLTPYESLYIPQRLGGEGGPDVTLPGGNTPGETVVGAQERPVGDPGSLQVPYVDALPYYSAVNRQAIDSGQVPLDLRELVRRYFSALEP